jgi:glycine dehydrogenase subunit 1
LSIPGVTRLVEAPIVREFAVKLPVSPAVAVERMAEEGYLAGVPVGLVDGVCVDTLSDATGLLVAATERRTRSEIDGYAAALEKVIR